MLRLWSCGSCRCTHIEVKVQEAGERSGCGLWELQQQRLQVEFELLLPLLHQTLRVLPQHLLWRKQPSVHLLLCCQLKGNTHQMKHWRIMRKYKAFAVCRFSYVRTDDTFYNTVNWISLGLDCCVTYILLNNWLSYKNNGLINWN